MSEAVSYRKEGPVAVLSLSRPDVRNAFDVTMRDALYSCLEAVQDDFEVRAVVLRGEGPAFCSGGDVSEFGRAPSPVAARSIRRQRDVWSLLRDLPKPVVAALHGPVVGGGLEMALLCDVRIAEPSSRCFLPETGLGVVPGVGGTQTVSRCAGPARAVDLVLTGREIGGEEAAAVGLVSRLVPREELDREALDLAKKLAAIPPALYRALARAVGEGMDLPLSQGLALEARLARRVEAAEP